MPTRGATARTTPDSVGSMRPIGCRSVVWFKRDLRVHDHEPLAEAAQTSADGVLGLYIYEPIVLEAEEHDPRHLAFVNGCLAELRRALRIRGSELVLAHGDAVGVLEQLRARTGFNHLFSHEETGLRATFERDLAVAAWAKEAGVRWVERAQHGVSRPTKSRDGWAKRWRAQMTRPQAPTPDAVPPFPQPLLDRIDPGEIRRGAADGDVSTQRGGTRAGTELLDSFLYQRGRRYQREMSSPITGAESCSRLSPHLAYGSVSIRSVFQAARMRAEELQGDRSEGAAEYRRSITSFEKRLRWHCHFIQKLEDEPEIEDRNFNRAYDGLRTENHRDWSAEEAQRFEAFRRGETGYPFVDACLRCLQETGWINFRMRAMLMSFASYHLWLHWKRPAVHLARLFTDFEPGIHYSQCQMQSGVTGINTVRIYSPIKQQNDQDPEGAFVRRWVPELEGVPDEHLAEPHTMPELTQQWAGCVIGEGYPGPIVLHKTAYAEAKRRVFAARATRAAKREAQRVYIKHGSRKRPGQRSSAQRPADDRGGATERLESNEPEAR